MDVRGRRLRKQSDEATAFISSMAFDGQIARHVTRVNTAHMVSLLEEGEVPTRAGVRCLRFLSKAHLDDLADGSAEDFHQLLEQRAVDALGVEVAGYLNLGKSRNDQVATALRMEVREQLIGLLRAVVALQQAALRVAVRDGTGLVPGYTHLQRAQPVTLAHHFFACFDSLQRNVERIFALYRRLNVSPMGSAALGGTEVKVDRLRVAKLLGFEGITANSIDAVSSRDFALEALSCACLVMIDVSRLAEEQVLWSSKEFGFVEVADEYSASSSIMPQKKNPVVAEIARAKCGSVMGSFVAVASILKGLPYSYNLDLQEITPNLWRGLGDACSSTSMMAKSLSSTKFNVSAIAESMRGDYSTATALANYLVRDHGVSFRQAHAMVGELVRISLEEGITLPEAVQEKLPAISSRIAKRITIAPDLAESILEPSNYLSSISTPGGSNPASIQREIRRRSSTLDQTRSAIRKLESSLAASERGLSKEAMRIATEVKR
ncbi:MAG: argininosuccinate lyase [Nitrososphaerota archaeon]|nr:argininosuccinate lyase [Nitrososphaerota archaeon]